MFITQPNINSNRQPVNNQFLPSSDIFINTATNSNIESKSRLFDAASVVFGLFIGYLITGATRHPVDTYANIYIAYFCIQGRGIAAMLGTFCMVISSFSNFCVVELLAIDIEPDTREQQQRQRSAIYRFLEKIELFQLVTHMVSYACLIVFFLSFCAGLYSMYRDDLDFIFFFLILGFGSIILILSLFIIWLEKKKTIQLVEKLRTPNTSNM